MGSNVITDKNRLSLNSPLLTQEWNQNKNTLTPNDVAINCRKKVWWRCSKCGFEWMAQIGFRYIKTLKNGIKSRLRNIKNSANCPYCQSFVSQRPELLKEWSYDKNKIDPIEVGHSINKYWWRCSICSYEWSASIYNRLLGHGNCPKCNSLQTKYPDLAKEFHLFKNQIGACEVPYSSHQKMWWKCSKCDYEWQAAVYSRINGNSCPKCKKIVLRDGTLCSSKVEAYWYLKFKNERKFFIHDQRYGPGIGYCRYDFYFPLDNTYVEVTGFHKKSKINYISYLRNIVKKRRYVHDVLHANFKFINYKLTKNDYQLIRNNMFS